MKEVIDILIQGTPTYRLDVPFFQVVMPIAAIEARVLDYFPDETTIRSLEREVRNGFHADYGRIKMLGAEADIVIMGRKKKSLILSPDGLYPQSGAELDVERLTLKELGSAIISEAADFLFYYKPAGTREHSTARIPFNPEALRKVGQPDDILPYLVKEHINPIVKGREITPGFKALFSTTLLGIGAYGQMLQKSKLQ